MLKRFWIFCILGGLIVAVIFFQTALSSPPLRQDANSDANNSGGNIAELDEPNLNTSEDTVSNKDITSITELNEELSTADNNRQELSLEDQESAGIVPFIQPNAEQPNAMGPVVAQAKALLDAVTNTVIGNNTPWLHLIWESQRAETNAGVMPENGKLVQVGPISDIWVQINGQGYVTASVDFMRDSSGNPIQISTYRDGIGRNLTLGITNTEAPQPFDQHLTSFITTTEADVEKLIQISEEVYNDRPLIFFSSYTQYPEAMYFEDLQITAIATEWREGYDPATGLRMVTEYIAYTPTGERIVYDKGETVSFEWLAEPPAEVLQILAQEVEE